MCPAVIFLNVFSVLWLLLCLLSTLLSSIVFAEALPSESFSLWRFSFSSHSVAPSLSGFDCCFACLACVPKCVLFIGFVHLFRVTRHSSSECPCLQIWASSQCCSPLEFDVPGWPCARVPVLIWRASFFVSISSLPSCALSPFFSFFSLLLS